MEYFTIPDIETDEQEIAFARDLLSRIVNGDYALFLPKDDYDILIYLWRNSDPCEVRKEDFGRSKDIMLSFSYGWGLRKNFTLAEKINRELLWLWDFGMYSFNMGRSVQMGKGMYFPGIKMDEDCPKFADIDQEGLKIKEGRCEAKSKVLQLRHFKLTTILWSIGAGTALITFLGELIVGRIKKNKGKRNRGQVATIE